MRFDSKRIMVIIFLLLSLIFSICNAETTSKPTESPLSEEDLRNQISIAEKNLAEAVSAVNEIHQMYPSWIIVGEIQSTNSNGELIIWGRATSQDQPPASHPGWLLIKEGNIIVQNPDKEKIVYNRYAGGIHYYIKDTVGTNAFGGLVPIKVYGPLPKTIKQKIDEKEGIRDRCFEQLSDLKQKLINFTIEKYNNKIKDDPNNADLYKEFGNKCIDLYNEISGSDKLKELAFSNFEKYLDFIIEKSNNRIKSDPNNADLYKEGNKCIDLYNEISNSPKFKELAFSNFEKFFEKYLELNPKDTSFAIWLGRTYLMSKGTGYEEKAFNCFTKVAAVDPSFLIKDDSSWLEPCVAGKAYFEKEQYDTAIGVLDTAQKITKDTDYWKTPSMLKAKAYLILALNAINKKDYESTMTYISQISSQNLVRLYIDDYNVSREVSDIQLLIKSKSYNEAKSQILKFSRILTLEEKVRVKGYLSKALNEINNKEYESTKDYIYQIKKLSLLAENIDVSQKTDQIRNLIGSEKYDAAKNEILNFLSYLTQEAKRELKDCLSLVLKALNKKDEKVALKYINQIDARSYLLAGIDNVPGIEYQIRIIKDYDMAKNEILKLLANLDK